MAKQKENPLKPLIDEVKEMRKKGAKLGKPVLEPTPKFKKETDHSVTISYLSNGCGNNEMKLNIHAFRTANCPNGTIHLSIIDHNKKTLGMVVLNPCQGDLMPFFEQISSIM